MHCWCFVVALLQTVASHKNLMERVIVTKQNNPEGYYIIRLFHSGNWVNIVVSVDTRGTNDTNDTNDTNNTNDTNDANDTNRYQQY